MSKIRLKNEKIKRKYVTWLKEAEGYSELTIEAVENALWKYEDFVKHDDFANFNSDLANKFKKSLMIYTNPKTQKCLSLSSRYHILRHLNNFFTWLSGQSGYKSKIKAYDVKYLRLSKEETRKAISPKLPAYPSLSYIKKLCSFSINNEIDQRDRALIAFTALSGMRDFAIVTLKIKCFDPEKLVINQDPKFGVHTKFSKTIYTALFNFDEILLDYFLEWYKYLVDHKTYGNDDPLFPSTNIELEGVNKHVFQAKGVIAKFWSNAEPMRKIFKLRSKQMNLEYYSPHKFRHFAINEASKYANTAEELKAISQNVGHEHLTTTFFSYGAIDPYRSTNIISNMSFRESTNKKLTDEKLEQIKKIIEN